MTSTALRPFHLAIPVDDLARAEQFYGGVLGCAKGRFSDQWIDFDFFGHQLVVHLAPAECEQAGTNEVDGEQVPVKHFGVVLDGAEWQSLAQRLANKNVQFIIEPNIRFKGKPGEQGTFFFKDPAGNALEFKYFDDPDQLFAT